MNTWWWFTREHRIERVVSFRRSGVNVLVGFRTLVTYQAETRQRLPDKTVQPAYKWGRTSIGEGIWEMQHY